MAEITYIIDGQERRTVEFSPGESVMVVAVNNDIPGIEGECGGEMNCGTCHVYVMGPWVSLVKEIDWDEEALLEVVDNRLANSRLGCQIELRGDLDRIEVEVPGAGS